MIGSLIQKEMGEREVIEETFLKNTHTHTIIPQKQTTPIGCSLKEIYCVIVKKEFFRFFFFLIRKTKILNEL
jgi:hypothetical protein